MSSCIDEHEGMTDLQFKSFILTQLQSWKDMQELTIKSGNPEAVKKIEDQIASLEQMLRL